MMHMLGKLENDQVNTLKKNWAGVPQYIMIFSSPQALFPANIKCLCVCVCVGGGGGGRQKRVGYLHYFELLKLAPKYNSRSDRQDSKDR